MEVVVRRISTVTTQFVLPDAAPVMFSCFENYRSVQPLRKPLLVQVLKVLFVVEARL